MSAEAPRSGSTAQVTGWMFLGSVLLFWLPVVGPLAAGFLGGRHATTVGRALLAACAPAILVGLLVVLVLVAFDLPVIGTIAGVGVAIAVLVQNVPLFIGAWLGAAVTPDA